MLMGQLFKVYNYLDILKDAADAIQGDNCDRIQGLFNSANRDTFDMGDKGPGPRHTWQM